MSRVAIALTLATLGLLLVVAYRIKRDDALAGAGARNLEATYHVLHTATSLREAPLSHHWMLPTVTPNRPSAHGVPWGAALPNRSGDMIYFSFSPAGFLAPVAWFAVIGRAPDLIGLTQLNSLLGAFAALLLYALCFRVLRTEGLGPNAAAIGSLASGSIGVFSSEALLSHGIVYWSHSLFEPAFIGFLLSLHWYHSAPTRSPKAAWAVAVIAFLCAYIEWSGFLMNAVVTVFLARPGASPDSRALAKKIAIATAVAAGLFVVPLLAALGPSDFPRMLAARLLQRSAHGASVINLVNGYALSYGVFLGVVLLAWVIVRVSDGSWLPRMNAALAVTLVAACGALLENGLLMQHATQFSFDRLKFIALAAIMISIAFARLPARARCLLVVGIVLASWDGVQGYRADVADHQEWIAAQRSNSALLASTKRLVNLDCAFVVSEPRVRGYTNVLLHREAMELTDYKPSRPASVEGCGRVVLYGDALFTDLPLFTRAEITFPSGKVRTVVAGVDRR